MAVTACAAISAALVAQGRSMNEGVRRSPASGPEITWGAPPEFAKSAEYTDTVSRYGAEMKDRFFSSIFPPDPIGRALVQLATLTEARDSGDAVVSRLSRDAVDFLRAQPAESFDALADQLDDVPDDRFFVEKQALLRFAIELQVDSVRKVSLLSRELNAKDEGAEGDTAHALYVSTALEGLMNTSVDPQSLLPVLREAMRARRGGRARENFVAAVRGYSRDLADNLKRF